MEHLHHFELRLDPFQNEPDPRFLVETASFADAHRRVDRALRQSKGLVVLTGAAGVGKTVLARAIWESLEEELFEAQMTVIMPGVADAQNVLRRFALQLGVDEPNANRGDLLPQLYDQLSILREDGRQCVFIIDDAHILGSDALAELAGLLQLEYEGRRLFSMLLVGLPALDGALSEHAVTGHRVDVRTRLEPLDPADISKYLAHRIQVAGGQPPILTPDAVSALGKYGRGRPRLLNSLADNALYEAYLAERKAVEAYDVERAATDLGIGPDPGDTFVSRAPERTSVVAAPRPAAPAEPEEAELAPLAPPPLAPVAPKASGAAAARELPPLRPAASQHTPVVVASTAPEAPRSADELLPIDDLLDPSFDLPEAQMIGEPVAGGDAVDELFAELLEDE